jgi:hypothetical protein
LIDNPSLGCLSVYWVFVVVWCSKCHILMIVIHWQCC